MRYIKGLRIDYDFGEGEVAMPDDFTEMNAMFRMDVLGDWLGELQAMYEAASTEHLREMLAYQNEGV